MTDAEATALLQWAAPRLGLRWTGFSQLRRQVCRRIVKRARAVGLDAEAYRQRLESDPDELRAFDALCFVTISRFYRDGATFDALGERLAGFSGPIRVWSAGCASGEEPFSVAMLSPTIEVVATDRDGAVLERAARGEYGESSLRELPPALRARWFDGHRIRDDLRARVRFEQADIRSYTSTDPFHVVLCRNVAFTYFAEPAQVEFARRVAAMLVESGLLTIGNSERVPDGVPFARTSAPHILARVPQSKTHEPT